MSRSILTRASSARSRASSICSFAEFEHQLWSTFFGDKVSTGTKEPDLVVLVDVKASLCEPKPLEVRAIAGMQCRLSGRVGLEVVGLPVGARHIKFDLPLGVRAQRVGHGGQAEEA